MTDLRPHEHDAMNAPPVQALDLYWYALRVDTGREMRVWHEMVNDHGYDAFCPVLTRWVRKGRSRNVKDRIEKPFALLPGYLFAGFPDPSRVPFYDIQALNDVRGFLGQDGSPKQIPARQVQLLADRFAAGEWRAEQRYAAKERQFLKVGDIIPASALKLPVKTEGNLTVTKVRGPKAILAGLGILGCDTIELDMRTFDAGRLKAVNE